MLLYKIRDWSDTYENSRTKEMKTMSWLPLPIKLSGSGYVHLAGLKNGAAIFGCFIGILEAAAQTKTRGELWRTAGIPHTARTLAAVIRQSEDLVESTLGACCSQDCDWIECVEINEVTPTCGEPAGLPPETCGEPAGLPPETCGEPAGKPPSIQTYRQTDNYSLDFLSFWSAYPKKVGKGAAWKEWQREKPPIESCLKTLAWQVVSNDWTKEGGRYIVDPERWIKCRRWEDQPTKAQQKPEDKVAFPHY